MKELLPVGETASEKEDTGHQLSGDPTERHGTPLESLEAMETRSNHTNSQGQLTGSKFPEERAVFNQTEGKTLLAVSTHHYH